MERFIEFTSLWNLKVVNRDRKATLITSAKRQKAEGAVSPSFKKQQKLYGETKRASQRDASQVQASSKVRSEYFPIKLYYLLESIIRPTQSSRRGSNPKQRPTVHPFGERTGMHNINMDVRFTRDEDGSSE
jgi:hypothetical protein